MGGYLLSVWPGLFGFTEVRTAAGIAAGLVEAAGFAVLITLALAPPPAGSLSGFPATIPAVAGRWAAAAAAALGAAALVLFAVAVAGAGAAAPVAAGTGRGSATVLKTTTIGGMMVLTNAGGFTLYRFAPDPAATSKCYGSCAA